jgi:signal transduction histidine kinase
LNWKARSTSSGVAADLGSFSRQEKSANNEKVVNLNNIVRKTVELFKKPGDLCPKITLNLEKKIYAVNFDEAKIQQAIVKILENAIQALPDGGRGNIFITTRSLDLKSEAHDRNVKLSPGHYICVEITDDGCGIPSENINRVFEPFFTTKVGCRGLGLTWVYGIITNNGGNVLISSEPCRGTTVKIYICLPMAKL